MKKILFLAVILIFTACREDIVNFEVRSDASKIYITSYPAGADIWFNGTNTGKKTPDSLSNLAPGLYPIVLKLVGYNEIQFSVYLTKGEKEYIRHSFNKN